MSTVEALGHRNLSDFGRFMARLDPAARVLDAPGILAVRGPTDWPSSRTVVRVDPAGTAEQFLAEMHRFLFADGKTACVSCRVGADDDISSALVAEGFREYAQTPEMVCEARLEDRAAPDGITVRLATTPADVRAYGEIAGEAFAHLGMPAEFTRDTIDNADVMLGADVAVALADLDGQPVAGACSILFGAEPLGYVGWVACADSARGRGLGDVVTRRVTNEAFDRGAQLVSLEASHFGEHTYARMGYRELYRYRLMIKV